MWALKGVIESKYTELVENNTIALQIAGICNANCKAGSVKWRSMVTGNMPLVPPEMYTMRI